MFVAIVVVAMSQELFNVAAAIGMNLLLSATVAAHYVTGCNTSVV